jgi:hypothetical protein
MKNSELKQLIKEELKTILTKNKNGDRGNFYLNESKDIIQDIKSFEQVVLDNLGLDFVYAKPQEILLGTIEKDYNKTSLSGNPVTLKIGIFYSWNAGNPFYTAKSNKFSDITSPSLTNLLNKIEIILKK